MEKFVFLGTERRVSKTGNTYFMLYFGSIIDVKNGIGVVPNSSRIDNETFSDFTSLALGVEFECSYQKVYDQNNRPQIIIQKYNINI